MNGLNGLSAQAVNSARSELSENLRELGALNACRELVLYWSCRLSSFGALNWADDPALLALVFC